MITGDVATLQNAEHLLAANCGRSGLAVSRSEEVGKGREGTFGLFLGNSSCEEEGNLEK